MVKCPNCGSTAQVRMVIIKQNKIHYSCGCGCQFVQKVREEHKNENHN